MDLIALAFYAAVCGILGLISLQSGAARVARLATGSIIAATVLPAWRATAGL